MEGQFGKQMCPCCPSGGPEMGRAVMLRELAKDEEVTLPGSQLCQNLWDPFLFTTLNLISSTIAPFISLSFSSFHVLLSLIVSGALVPGSLSLFLLAFFSWFLKKRFFFNLFLPIFKQPFFDFYLVSLRPPPFYLGLHFFHLNRSNSISPTPHSTVRIYYLSSQQCLRMCFPLFIDVGLLLSQLVIALWIESVTASGLRCQTCGFQLVMYI